MIARLLRWGPALAAAAGCAAHAEPVHAGADRVAVGTCVAPMAGDVAAALAGGPAFRCGGRQQRFGPGDFWVRAASLPPEAGLSLDRVRYGNLWQARTTMYARYADGRVIERRIEPGRESGFIQLGSGIELRLPQRGVRVTELLWRVEGSPNVRGILYGPELLTDEASAHDDLSSAALYAGFAGLCLALLVFNLALWVAVRHRFQLAYCAMVATLLGYATTGSGALMWLCPGLANNDRLRITYVMLAASGASAIWFARTFLEPRIFAGWLGRAATGVAAAIVATALLFAGLAPAGMHALDRLHGAAFVAQLLLTLPILWNAVRRRSRFTLPFAIAWSGGATMAGIRVVNTFQLLPTMIAVGQAVVLLMTAQVLLSSLAIAYRIHLLGRERDQARAQEIAARLLADTDPLTGLMNRRAFLAGAIGREGPQRLLIADLDHFKAINETVGHDGGDEVLRLFAQALRRAAPPGALVARIGGEEFAVVADAASGLTPQAITDALRAERMPWDLIVTASIGGCVGPLAREADWKRLYRQADRALFAAKAAGRDRAREARSLLAA